MGKPGVMGVARSMGEMSITSRSSSLSNRASSSSSGTAGKGGEFDAAARAFARSEALGSALKEPIETCRREALVDGTGSDVFETGPLSLVESVCSLSPCSSKVNIGTDSFKGEVDSGDSMRGDC